MVETKTFDVWVKKKPHCFNVCSKKVDDKGQLIEITKKDVSLDEGAAEIRFCDVSRWLKTLGLKHGEVVGARITFSVNVPRET